MRKIKIVFTRPDKSYQPFPIFSWLIRLVEWTKYSHVAIIFKSNSLDRELVYQASGLKVHFIGGKMFRNQVEILHSYDINISDKQYKKTLQSSVDKIQKPYGIKQMFGYLWVILARKFGKSVNNPFKDGDYSYVCSELVAEAIPLLNKQFKGRLDSVTPKDLKEYLESSL